MSRQAKPKADFASALAELEALVGRMESGQASLEEAMQCFTRGTELVRECRATLAVAEASLDELARADEETSAAPACRVDAP